MNNIFASPNTIRLLIRLNENHNKLTASKISRELHSSLSTTINLIIYLEKLKLVDRQVHGREKYITLSKKGKKIATKLYEIKELLEDE